MLGQSELTLSHRLHELFGLFGEAFCHPLRFFRVESLQLIEERHLFDFFLRIFFHFRSLPRDFRFINLAFTLRCKIRHRAHASARVSKLRRGLSSDPAAEPSRSTRARALSPRARSHEENPAHRVPQPAPARLDPEIPPRAALPLLPF